MIARKLVGVLQEKAKKELNEVPNRVQEDLKDVKEWIAKQPHLNVRMEDQWLLGFLRGCKFSLQRTKEKLDMYYTTRTLLPDLFANRNPFLPEIQALLQKGAVVPLPVPKDSANTRVIFFRWCICDTETVSIQDVIKLYFMVMDILMLEDDNSMVSGKQMIAEFTGFSVNHLLQLTPPFVKKAVTCLQKAYPIRIKGIYCVNAPAVFETVYNLARGFLTEKLKTRAFMFSESNTNKVYEHVPRSAFPQEYGGSNGSLDELAVEWKKKVESYSEWFKDDSKYGSNEALRVGKPQTSAEMFGVEGSFRKLTID